MKIGIITWFSYENYGTVLQAYALQRFIRNEGYDCELVNYLTSSSCKKKINVEEIKKKIIDKKNNLIYKYIYLKKRRQIENKSKSFKNFIINNCVLTEILVNKNSLVELNKKIDTYICGSDQVWSPNELDGAYFLDFVNDNNKRISYAPSFGVSEIPDEYKDIVSKWMSKFDHLSVREKQGADIIKRLTGREATIVLDPTLLLKPEDWNIIADDANIQEPYILCYFLSDKREYWKNVEKIRKATGYKVVIIPVVPPSYLKKGMILPETGPSEFVGLIKNAEIVLTDSFHGTIFAINYKKDFYTFKRFSDKDKKSENSRIYNILEKLNLENRLISNNQSVLTENIKILNYGDVESRLVKEREKSIKFLNISLQNKN